ncbi:MAG TPA: hypothetical protein VJ743_11090 [Albitalea sp.]|nr:hypothetical protein [Albitalea sp.]
MIHSAMPRAMRGLCRWLTGVGLATGGLAWAQGGDPMEIVPAQVKLGIEKVKLPGDERMGLVGTSYLIGVGHGLAFGPAVYGAVSGHRGGLFTVGAEAAWQHRLVGPLTADLGFYAGGGGGGAAPVGGGLMLRPHADLLWDFGPFLAGLSWSQVRFANGDINSRQLGLVWSAKTDFRYVPRDRIGLRSDMGGRSGMGFDRIQAVFGAYKPRSGAKRVSGADLSSTIGFVGTRVERAIDDHRYWGLEASGAASGGVAGYAEYLATYGTETTVWPGVLTVGARASLGMGGGGDVGVGGGLLLKGGAYGTVRLTRELGLSIEGGYTMAPQGSFKALHTAASLNWILDDPSDLTSPPRNTRTEWVGGVERYRAQRRDGSERTLQAVTLKGNRFVARHVYLSGQVHSAYGGGAGGYTVGLFGLGVQAPLFARVHAGAEALIGAAGGGGVATQGGAIMQPSAYLGVDISPSLSVRVGAGKIKSLRGGGLDANVVDVALAFTFGVAGHGYR